MSLFVQPAVAPLPKTTNVRLLSLGLVAVFVVLAVAQLFMFERFPNVLASYWLPGGTPTARLLAALLVSGEVLALPFWLSMRLSLAMRVLSMGLGWLVTLTWLLLALWANLTTNAMSNIGILGREITLPVGWWAVCLFMALGVVVAWVSWGMWPITHMGQERK